MSARLCDIELLSQRNLLSQAQAIGPRRRDDGTSTREGALERARPEHSKHGWWQGGPLKTYRGQNLREGAEQSAGLLAVAKQLLHLVGEALGDGRRAGQERILLELGRQGAE